MRLRANAIPWQALAKFATLLMAINDMLEDNPLAQAGLNQLKVAFARFAENKQQYPLVYECKCIHIE